MNIKKSNSGFTIIEVMIVLVIAAVILLIVFLAVPALQRNSRNNQRKNDISRVVSGIAEWASNNGGRLPSTDDEKSQALQNVGTGAFYSTAPAWTVGTTTNANDPDSFQIATSATCGSNGNATASTNTRRYVALYSVESGSGNTPLCVES